MDLMKSEVGIVVPTLGNRLEYLNICLKSIKANGNPYILVVAPDSIDLTSVGGLFNQRITDPGRGLSEAINFGISKLPNSLKYVNWIGDDDFYEPNGISLALLELKSDTKIVAVYGGCNYVDKNGNVLFKNSGSQWASRVMQFGPNLIPQPGMLFRREIFESFGGLKSHWKLAFDFDMLFELKKRGSLKFIDQTLANFRWHSDSLSVANRFESAREASQIRIQYLPWFARYFAALWEYPIRVATSTAGILLSLKLNKREKEIHV